jgi:hypothetical protein
MRLSRPHSQAFLGVVLSLTLATLGCMGSSGTGNTPPSPPPTPPQFGLAWFAPDGSGEQQLYGNYFGFKGRQITHVPTSISPCESAWQWGPPIFSPDLKRIVVGWNSAPTCDHQLEGDLTLVQVATGVMVPAGAGSIGSCRPHVALTYRVAGWLNNDTIWAIDAVHFYTLSAIDNTCKVSATLGDHSTGTTSTIVDAVVRGTTLYYSLASGGIATTCQVCGPGTPVSQGHTLHRYDLLTNKPLPGTIDLGNGTTAFGAPGFDVTPDGQHIAYQVLTSVAGANPTSHVYYANADGSGATEVLTASSQAETYRYLQLSPDGLHLSIANVGLAIDTDGYLVDLPTTAPTVVHDVGNIGGGYPQWLFDSSSYYVSGLAPGEPIHHDTCFLILYGKDGTVPKATLKGTVEIPVPDLHGCNPWFSWYPSP